MPLLTGTLFILVEVLVCTYTDISIWLLQLTFDSVFGKRVLTYWENRGNLNLHQMNVFIVAMENYIFLERGESHLFENI